MKLHEIEAARPRTQQEMSLTNDIDSAITVIEHVASLTNDKVKYDTLQRAVAVLMEFSDTY